MKIDLLIEILQRVLTSTPGLSLAYLFGSQVDESTGPLSDIDLGIVLEEVKTVFEVQSLLTHQLMVELKPVPVDVIHLRDAPIEMAYAVIAKGICVFQRDTLTRVEFEAEIMSRYGDYLPVLRAHRQSILEESAHDRRVQRYRAALGRTERTLEQIRTLKEQNAP